MTAAADFTLIGPDSTGAPPPSDLGAALARIRELEDELARARANEEAVHLTLMAATKTKEELLGAAQRQLDEATRNASAEADKITSEAQYKAFKMITDAKEDAESTLEEAKVEAERLVASAREEAETTLSQARREAIGIITEIRNEGEKLIAEREGELARMGESFETNHSTLVDRVTKLQMIADDLEARLRAVASGAIDDIISATGMLVAELAADGELLGLIKQRSAGLRRPAPDDEDTEERQQRGSYYTRRSAKLPRLGRTADQTQASIQSLRSGLVAAEPEDAEELEAQPA